MKALFAVFPLVLGLTNTASAQNFNFTLQPDTLTLNPDQSSSFLISVSPTGGFTNPVTFSVSNLPSGITASFSPNPVNPPGTTLLTLDASSDAATGSSTLYITGEGGGITNMTTGTVTVNFGLLPTCYGAIQGQITDTTTGKPVPYATITASYEYYYYAMADSNGYFIITNMMLGGTDNQPVNYGLTVTRSNYWVTYTNAYAVCDATNVINAQILLQQPGSLTGTLTSSTTGQPLTNVYVNADYQNYYEVATTNGGAFSFPSLALGNDNATVNYSVSAQPTGYWQAYTNVYIQANSNAVVDLVAIPICYDTVSGKVIYANSGMPATNVSVQLNTSATYYATTDVNGDYTITNVQLGTDNNSTYATVYSSVTGYNYGATNLYLTNCGESVIEPTLALTPVAVVTYNYGALTGQVFDITSGQPIPYAGIYDYSYGGAQADSNGFYMITNIEVGTGTTTNAGNYVIASATGYFTVGSNIEVYANEATTLDFYLLRTGYGYIQGTVVDSVSGLPVPGVSMGIPNYPVTDSNGFYASAPLVLSTGNSPTYESFYAYKTGYWETYTNTTITNGLTNIVNIELLKVCTGASIIGKVVDALNQEPITDATVYASGITSGTDSNGLFVITNITVGNDNSPSSVTVTAQAPGFITQSKNVEIFCGATISTVFGVPATNFGAIEGYVTNVLTGAPITNVFIGSSFGASTYTDTNGYYFLGTVPIFASNQTWSVTAQPGNYNYSLSKTTPVATNETNVVDFGFGAPPTALVVSNTGTPNPVYVTSNLVYTVTLTNSVNPAANVVLLDTLPPGVTVVSAYLTNDPEGDFSPPVMTNGAVSTTATNFDSNSVVYLFITVTANSAGAITNVATVTSDTPDVDTTDSNHIATAITTVIAPTVTNYADLAISITGAPNPVLVDNQLVYMLYVTNYGPADAPNVYVTNYFPPDVVFSSATPSQGTYTTSGNTLVWNVGNVPDVNGPGSASAMIVVEPTLAGTIIDEATVGVGPALVGGVTVIDTNLANNTAYATNLVTGQTITNESVQYGDIVFDPQTGLYEQTVQYNNLNEVTVSAIRVSITGLPNYVTVYNASGVSNKVPYVEYDQPVPGGSNAVFLVEYYDASRKPFTSTNFTATVVVAVTVPPPVGTQLQLDNNGQFIDKLGQVTIEFATVPGHAYVVEYSGSISGPWVAATPPIVAVNTRTQWTDAGPPVTSSPPSGTGNRFYQVVETK
ncbi:MAG TPA: hypothetical protein VH595_01355 [Verrucomicrobiae bacterium]|nr:hypothetical protein [Verrucomicrobiae bacterium]